MKQHEKTNFKLIKNILECVDAKTCGKYGFWNESRFYGADGNIFAAFTPTNNSCYYVIESLDRKTGVIIKADREQKTISTMATIENGKTRYIVTDISETYADRFAWQWFKRIRTI